MFFLNCSSCQNDAHTNSPIVLQWNPFQSILNRSELQSHIFFIQKKKKKKSWLWLWEWTAFDGTSLEDGDADDVVNISRHGNQRTEIGSISWTESIVWLVTTTSSTLGEGMLHIFHKNKQKNKTKMNKMKTAWNQSKLRERFIIRVD